jgi:hypothetical protein
MDDGPSMPLPAPERSMAAVLLDGVADGMWVVSAGNPALSRLSGPLFIVTERGFHDARLLHMGWVG